MSENGNVEQPLTNKQLAWFKKLEATMRECPSERIASYTIGDSDLVFYDWFVLSRWRKENQEPYLGMGEAVRRSGAYLYTVHGGFTIDSAFG